MGCAPSQDLAQTPGSFMVRTVNPSPDTPEPQNAEDVLAFWFANGPASETEVRALMKRWFGSNSEFDAYIGLHFAALMTAAAQSDLADWAATPRGRLALILLLDQFPRSVHRGTSAAFAQDALALDLTVAGIGAGLDQTLSPLERLFFYMPMQHSESLAIQQQSVAQFEELAASASEPFLHKALAGSADFARQHRDIIAEFGRFPHRNAVLGRSNTPKEARYLEQGGPSFGQPAAS
jgi:uncharacterized protein (DUF924 family)